jgi:hypothetical protein
MLRRAFCLLLVAILPSHVTLAQPLAQPGSATPGAGPSAGSPASAPADATAAAPAPTAVAKGPAQAPGPAASSTPAPGSTGAAATGKHHPKGNSHDTTKKNNGTHIHEPKVPYAPITIEEPARAEELAFVMATFGTIPYGHSVQYATCQFSAFFRTSMRPQVLNVLMSILICAVFDTYHQLH